MPYDREEFLACTKKRSATAPDVTISPVEIRPEPFQERQLEQIALSRQQGHHRNLLVSATGTGKTVMAALDYLTSGRKLLLAHAFHHATSSVLSTSSDVAPLGIGS